MIDTIVSVTPRDGTRPGRVKLSGKGDMTTFSDALLEKAQALKGQRVEYQIEKKEGKNGRVFENISDVAPVGGDVPSGASSPSGSSDDAIRELASAIRSFTEAYLQVNGYGKATLPPAPAAAVSLETSIAKAQEALAGKIGSEAANAQITAVLAKLGFKTAGSVPTEGYQKVRSELGALLAAHGIV